MAITKQDVLEYHSRGRPGKIEVTATKPLVTQRDLSLAYSPGVAEAVIEVENNPAAAYDYTAKGNLVAVVSNGTAILGLGDRGALASKPVMEGKGVLFKTFADIDVFDIEVNSHDDLGNDRQENLRSCRLRGGAPVGFATAASDCRGGETRFARAGAVSTDSCRT